MVRLKGLSIREHHRFSLSFSQRLGLSFECLISEFVVSFFGGVLCGKGNFRRRRQIALSAIINFAGL
jgi:hypothetical protein